MLSISWLFQTSLSWWIAPRLFAVAVSIVAVIALANSLEGTTRVRLSNRAWGPGQSSCRRGARGAALRDDLVATGAYKLLAGWTKRSGREQSSGSYALASVAGQEPHAHRGPHFAHIKGARSDINGPI